MKLIQGFYWNPKLNTERCFKPSACFDGIQGNNNLGPSSIFLQGLCSLCSWRFKSATANSLFIMPEVRIASSFHCFKKHFIIKYTTNTWLYSARVNL